MFGVIEFFKPRTNTRGANKRVTAPPPAEKREVVVRKKPGFKSMMEIGVNFTIDPALYKDGDRDAIFAQSGMGKSYLAGVIVEETLECGGMVFVMDPEGENWTLSEKYPVVVVGGKHKTWPLDLRVASENDIFRMVKKFIVDGVSAVFDLSGMAPREKGRLFAAIGGSMFQVMDNDDFRRPLKFIVEEARLFAPQKPDKMTPLEDGSTCSSVFIDIAVMGRKRGINMLVATQRPSTINKDVITQANRWWFGGVKASQDCKALAEYLGEAGITDAELRALKPGWFYFYDGRVTRLVEVRPRKCRHGGATPQYAGRPVAGPERVAEILAEARKK